MPKATCPNNPDHKHFITTAAVMQTWMVDADGDFMAEISTDETLHKPNVGNTWTCNECGAEAKVTD
jgi:succinate dehydrogenase/fumarate reductase-like Fe-S protein